MKQLNVIKCSVWLTFCVQLCKLYITRIDECTKTLKRSSKIIKDLHILYIICIYTYTYRLIKTFIYADVYTYMHLYICISTRPAYHMQTDEYFICIASQYNEKYSYIITEKYIDL